MGVGRRMIRVLLVDDEELVRSGLRLILSTEPDLEVAAEAADGEQALAMVELHQPDVVMLDIRMPGLDGIEVARRLAASGSPARVVVLTTFDNDDYVYGALRAGASGFLLKDAPATQLVSAIRAAAAGDAVLAPSVTRRVVDELGRRQAPAAIQRLDVLTDRERDVLTLMAEGCSNSEIGDRLFITEGTVKTHVARILVKLGVRDRLQAVVLAYRAP
ncbi:MAG TPA: response regulator transcription factor [Nocardioides sp.]|nr:response regulator transcription factor [Nocardioides sp.]